MGRSLFSLVDPPLPWFQNQPLFHSYDLKELKKELARLETLEKEQAVRFDAQTEPLREQIHLIELLNTPADGPDLLKANFERTDAYQAELMYRLAMRGNKEAMDSFSRKAGEYFWCLKQLASDGHAAALQCLATMAIEATEVVNHQAVKQPELFQDVAAGQTHWPFLKSQNRLLNLIKTEAEDSFLKKLHSGEATHQDLAPAKRYKPEGPANEVAQRLLDYVAGMRNHARLVFGENLFDKPQPEYVNRDFLRLAGQLPDPAEGHRAADEWWKLAKCFLLESYPALDPKSTAEVQAVAPMLLKVSQTSEKKRKTRILYNLERAFENILAKPPGTIRITS